MGRREATSNGFAHDVSFEMAREVFKDISSIERADREQGGGEQRFVTVGMVENRLVFVSFTL